MYGGDALARKLFSTTIEESIWREFKIACTIEGKNMNDVLEEFMIEYAVKAEEKRKPK